MVLKNRYQRSGLAFALQTVVVLISIMITFSTGVYLGANTIENYRRDLLIEQAKAIDHALAMYAKAHIGINTSSTTLNVDKDKLDYTKTAVYPQNLKELGVIRDNFSYLSQHLKFQSLDVVNYDLFRYSVQTDSNGKMKYQLEVQLPNGYNYTSPGSNK